ncbi:winged helix-turn-helix domain-containing protein [Pseudoalteromonas sp. T1lg48]|uniref:winged helix-turn-helix domain-containing protein n=1 Tax=Pseudoalteromonas sp. T1lg48 TaxID=2077100 RepID=UPI001319C6BC|nr:winged helix-turn-helix domain-containing protein [Pseudoalteromonas sp. T1lg48]
MYRIGEYVFDYQHGQLCTNGESKKIEPQLNELLKLFVDRRGELVSRQLLIDTLWPNRVITDDAYRAVIKKLRKSLGDDAKNPRYIRTIPTKGFILIAAVEDIPESAQPVTIKSKVLVACTVLLALFGLVFHQTSQQTVPAVTIEKLTALTGSEVSPGFDANNKRLVFSHRANKDDYLQLFSKQLNADTVTRLTFDNANYANAHFSPNGLHLAYTRSTPEGSAILVADYSKEKALLNAKALPAKVANKRYLLGWSMDGAGLYLSDAKQPSSSQKIWYFEIASQTFSNVTAPADKDQGDYFARESNDGKRLAILRSTGATDSELLIQHKDTGELTHINALPHPFNQLIWNDSDSTITLSSFNGKFAQYKLSNSNLTPLPLSLPHINNVFHHCGARCLFARQHNGNYLDLTLSPNPFSAQQTASHEYLEFAGNEDLPQLGALTHSIYFISQGTDTSELVRITNGKTHTLWEFPSTSQLSALQINYAETQVAGIVDGRLFLYDLKQNKLKYLSSELEQIASLYWQESNEDLMFARLEYALPVLYRYELKTNTKVRVDDASYAALEINDGVAIKLDQDLNVWRLSEGKKQNVITQLPSASPNRWQVHGHWLYYTEHEENLAYLHRIDINTGEHKKTLLAKNRYRLTFDLSNDAKTLLGIRSVLAQSDLVRVTY